MRTSYVIQGRIVRRRGQSPRDEVRLDEATTEDDARQVARAFVAAGFTTWIFRVEPGRGTTPDYQLIATARPPHPASNPHTAIGRAA